MSDHADHTKLISHAVNPETLKTVYSSLPNVVDDILSKELLRLSLTARNAIGEEVHGVLTLTPDETPQYLEDSLARLSEELDLIPDDNPSKAAFLKSQRLPWTYVNTRDFRLRFLRSDFFDATKASRRIVTFLDIASELFGPKVLQRPIRMADFPKGEEQLLRVGNVQLLPFRDRSGRPIFTWVGDFGLSLGTDAFRARSVLYTYYALSDDIESQRKGVVLVIWIGSNRVATPASLESMRVFSKINTGSPLRKCAIHFCMPDKHIFYILRSMYAITHFSNTKTRIKFHVGDTTDLCYTLKGYGIPVELIPVTGTGNIKLVYWKQWMRLRKLIEKTREEGIETSIIECPGSNDIIFRTGTALTCHPGNVMFQSVIESKMKEHAVASQVGKIAITKDIIDLLRQKKGRFLQWDSGGYWTELKDPAIIYGKVANSVRDFKRKSYAKQNQQNSESSTSMFRNQDEKRRKLPEVNDSEWSCVRKI
mmetsp:Transcript_27603/g.64807  ORF Transcript_27603/g.64807 Transcript_27603/m.64807 type:complete len:480 (-) Transcript_27603:197-1636(-)